MSDAFSSIKGLLESEKYADLTISCSGEVFKVHCAILCTRSPFLARAVDGQFREAALRDIDLPEDEVSVIRAMIRYLYTDDYDDCKSCQEENPMAVDLYNSASDDGRVIGSPPSFFAPSPPRLSSPPPFDESLCLMFNVKMYIAGDKYDIPGLRTLAAAKFEQRAAYHWNSTVFSEAALHLWDDTVESDRQLRNIVISFVHWNIDLLLDRGEFTTLMKSNAELCFDVVKGMRGRSLEFINENPRRSKHGSKTKKKSAKRGSIWDLNLSA